MKTSITLALLLSTTAMAADPDHILLRGSLTSVMGQAVAACDSLGMRITQQTQNTLACFRDYRTQRFTLVTLGNSVRVSWSFEDALGPRAGMDGENALTLQALACNTCTPDRPAPHVITQKDRDDMALMNARIARMNAEAAKLGKLPQREE